MECFLQQLICQSGRQCHKRISQLSCGEWVVHFKQSDQGCATCQLSWTRRRYISTQRPVIVILMKTRACQTHVLITVSGSIVTRRIINGARNSMPSLPRMCKAFTDQKWKICTITPSPIPRSIHKTNVDNSMTPFNLLPPRSQPRVPKCQDIPGILIWQSKRVGF